MYTLLYYTYFTCLLWAHKHRTKMQLPHKTHPSSTSTESDWLRLAVLQPECLHTTSTTNLDSTLVYWCISAVTAVHVNFCITCQFFRTYSRLVWVPQSPASRVPTRKPLGVAGTGHSTGWSPYCSQTNSIKVLKGYKYAVTFNVISLWSNKHWKT